MCWRDAGILVVCSNGRGSRNQRDSSFCRINRRNVLIFSERTAPSWCLKVYPESQFFWGRRKVWPGLFFWPVLSCWRHVLPPQHKWIYFHQLSHEANAPLDAELKLVSVVIADQSYQTGNVKINATIPLLWRDALQTAVEQAGVFKDDSARKVSILATIKKFDSNSVGFANKAEVEAEYILINRSDGKELFKKDIITSADRGIGEEWKARARLINVWNMATQENIRQFLTALQQVVIVT